MNIMVIILAVIAVGAGIAGFIMENGGGNDKDNK